MLYARQIEPEYQESPLFYRDEYFPDNIAVCGNRMYRDRMPEVFSRVKNALETGELADALNDINCKGYYSSFYRNKTEVINDLLPPESGKGKYTTNDIHKLCECIFAYGSPNNSDKTTLCEILSIVTGDQWKWDLITGCCQRDWQYIYYPVKEWTDNKSIAYFESEYFNTGSQWIIHDESEKPSFVEDINGYSVYIHEWQEGKILAEFSEITGVKPEDIVLYFYAGETKKPFYKKFVAAN